MDDHERSLRIEQIAARLGIEPGEVRAAFDNPAESDYATRLFWWRSWALICFTRNDAEAHALTDRELMALISICADPVTHSEPDSINDKDRALLRKAMHREAVKTEHE